MTDDTTPLCYASFEQLVEEMMGRGSFVIGIVLTDSEGEKVEYFINDDNADIPIVYLAEGLLDATRDADNMMNTDFDRIEPFDPNESDEQD